MLVSDRKMLIRQIMCYIKHIYVFIQIIQQDNVKSQGNKETAKPWLKVFGRDEIFLNDNQINKDKMLQQSADL